MNITDYNLSDPLFNNIIIQLYPIEIYQLKLTNKYFNNNININIIKNQTINIINQNLEIIFGDKLEEFKLLLKNINGVITGSFILSCMWGEYYDSSINIYTLTDYQNYHNKLDNLLNDTKKQNSTYTNVIVYGNIYTKLISNQSNKISNNPTIQFEILSVRPKNYINIFEFINIDYDLDICKNKFYIDRNNKYQIKFFNINQVLNKETNFFESYMCRKYKRSAYHTKSIYSERGVKFIN
jgi:hypothetical protein